MSRVLLAKVLLTRLVLAKWAKLLKKKLSQEPNREQVVNTMRTTASFRLGPYGVFEQIAVGVELREQDKLGTWLKISDQSSMYGVLLITYQWLVGSFVVMLGWRHNIEREE